MASKIAAISVIKQSNIKPSGSVIFFHGSGDTGNGVREWIKFLLGKDISFPHLRIIFPTAPLRHYTPMNGDLSNVWFDRLSISPDVPEHKETLDSIGHEVKQLVKQELSLGIPISKIIIGGFSMGGALAMHVGYRFLPDVAGVFAISSFLNKNSIVYDTLTKLEEKPQCPLFMCHGARDSLVPIDWGQETYRKLSEFGVKGQFHDIKNTFHELKKVEIIKLTEWINDLLPPSETEN